MKDAFPADYKLCNSLKNRRYYYDTKVNALKYSLAQIQAHLVKQIVKSTFGKV